MKKLFFALTLSIIALLLAFSISAMDYSGTCGANGDNLKWTLDINTHTLEITGTGDMMDCIWEYIDLGASSYMPWDRVSEYMNGSSIGIKTVIIGEGVTSIGEDAFDNSSWTLESITIPESLKSIGKSAFSFCRSLKSIYIPEGVTEIGESAFFCCDNLTIYGYSGSYAETYAKEENIPFVAIHTHTYDSGVITLRPTCTVDGVKTYTCTDCGEINTETVPMLGHTFGEAVIAEATCTAEGTKTVICTACQYQEVEIIVMLDHICNIWTESVPARAGVDGEESGVCVNCNNTVSRAIAALPANQPVIRLIGNTADDGKVHIFAVLENNLYGFNSFKFYINFDILHLSLHETLNANSIAAFKTQNYDDGVIEVVYTGSENVTADGTICELVFEPTGEPFEGELPVSVAMDSGSATYTANEENVALAPSLVGCTIYVTVTAPETTETVETTAPNETTTPQTVSGAEQSINWLILVIIILAFLVIVAIIVIIVLVSKRKNK